MGGPVLIEIHGGKVAIGQGQARAIEVDVGEP
jgi:Fe2+ transport system protein FeoA